MERRAVVIVGSGPAGAGSALALARADPGLARETLLLDKARHPRAKTCAGGVIPKAVRLLDELGVPFAVPHARVDAAGVARDRGVELREDVRVMHLVRDGDGVRVETDRATYWAPVVVGADGSGSVVRRLLVRGRAGLLARAVMCDVPVEATRWDGCA